MRKSGVRNTFWFLQILSSSFLSSLQPCIAFVAYSTGIVSTCHGRFQLPCSLGRGGSNVSRLCSFLERSNTSTVSRIARLIPLTRSVVERSNDFDNCENAENGLQNQQQSLEDNLEEDLPGQDPYGDEDEDLAIRPLSK